MEPKAPESDFEGIRKQVYQALFEECNASSLSETKKLVLDRAIEESIIIKGKSIKVL